MIDYSTVTEVAGGAVSREGFAMMRDRYQFVADRARDKDLLEVSCGAGFGLGATARVARSIVGTDITFSSLVLADNHYQGRIPLLLSDAMALPFASGSFDVVAMHEAIYYYPDARQAFFEGHRVLRARGCLVVSTINPDWSDFNPSPMSTNYLGAADLAGALASHFDRVELFGAFPVPTGGVKHRVLSAVKRVAVSWRLIPKTMKGKKILKRLFLGKLVEVPKELPPLDGRSSCVALSDQGADTSAFKVIYAVAHRS